MFGLFSGFKTANMAQLDPSTIFGSNLVAWYRGDSAINSSGVIATWNDKSGNGNTLTASGTARPTYNSSSSSFNNQISATFNGTTNAMSTPSNLVGGSGTIFYIFAVMRQITASTTNVFAQIGGTGSDLRCIYNSSGLFIAGFGGVNPVTGTIDWLNTPVSVSFYSVGSGSSSGTAYINEDNQQLDSGTYSVSEPSWTNQKFYLGFYGTSASDYANCEIAEIVITDVQPSTEQKKQLFHYAQTRYNVDPAVTLSQITNVGTAGNTARIVGSGFNLTTTASNSLVGSLSAVYKSSTLIEVTIPALAAGSYDITVVNTNTGLTTTQNSFIRVKSSASYDPMVIFGNNCVGWYQCNQVTSSSGNISAITDQSLLGNTLTASGSAEPTLNSSDSTFNNQPSMTLASANKQGLTTSNFQCETGSTISTMFLFCVAYVTGASDTLIGYSTSSIYLNFQSSTPYMSRASNNAIWGSTETSTAKNFSGYFSSTSNLVGVSVDNGTYVTASATNGTANNNLTLGLGIRGDASTQPMSGKIACGIVVNVVPTSTQLSNLQSWANNLFGT